MTRIIIPSLIAAALAGCQPPINTNVPREYVLVPASGTVTLDGKPLAGAVITFLQTDENGTTCAADVDEDGRYELSYQMLPGAAAATYRVAISYKLDKDGKPIDLEARSNPTRENGAHSAKELIPVKNSDMGRTTIRQVIPPKGGVFNFDLKGPLLPGSTEQVKPAGEVKSPRRDLSPPTEPLKPTESTKPPIP